MFSLQDPREIARTCLWRAPPEIRNALAAQPRLLLLDEPAAGMNPKEGHAMELIHFIRDRLLTILLIEHQMRVVMDL